MGQGLKPRIVLSAVSFVEAGPLSVFQDALLELSRSFLDEYDVTAIVHRKELFDIPGITYIEYPHVKKSWLRRLQFEYIHCRSLSLSLRPHLWLAMHDMTPAVSANIRAVYCHNPAPFFSPSINEAMLDPTVALFSMFYRFLYAIHIRQNDFVIVQQEWMRRAFQRRYSVKEIVVAHPSILQLPTGDWTPSHHSSKIIFIYPAFPRFFKNIELLLRAGELLEEAVPDRSEIWLTVRGDENRYAKSLFRKFGHVASVRWMGAQSRAQVSAMYAAADCLVFPSRLETWGMPISEFKQTGKQIIVADLPYAHETVGAYDKVQFISVDDAQRLADIMQVLIHGNLISRPFNAKPISAPYAEGWNELFQLLLGHSPSSIL